MVSLWQERAIKPVASKEIIDEYLRVLTYPRFRLDEAEINFILYHEILPYFDIIDAPGGERVIAEDPADDKFIDCALAGNAARTSSPAIRHLLALKSHNGIQILSSSDIPENELYVTADWRGYTQIYYRYFLCHIGHRTNLIFFAIKNKETKSGS